MRGQKPSSRHKKQWFCRKGCVDSDGQPAPKGPNCPHKKGGDKQLSGASATMVPPVPMEAPPLFHPDAADDFLRLRTLLLLENIVSELGLGNSLISANLPDIQPLLANVGILENNNEVASNLVAANVLSLSSSCPTLAPPSDSPVPVQQVSKALKISSKYDLARSKRHSEQCLQIKNSAMRDAIGDNADDFGRDLHAKTAMHAKTFSSSHDAVAALNRQVQGALEDKRKSEHRAAVLQRERDELRAELDATRTKSVSTGNVT
ncbi:hypothetical protein H0H92_006889, partial [Tricholoma furcatifolium]